MKLAKGDIVTFLSKEERETKYGTRPDGIPRRSPCIESFGAIAGIVEVPEYYSDNSKFICVCKDSLILYDYFSEPVSSVATVVGHIDNLNFSALRCDQQYKSQIFDEVMSYLPTELKCKEIPERKDRSVYSTDMLKIACDMIDEISDKCISSNVDNNDKYDTYSSFRYPVNARFQNFGEESVDYPTRNVFNNIEREDALDIMQRLRFKFGRNHLYVGEAVLCILNMLEARYGLDFNKLEDNVQEKAKENRCLEK